MNMMDVNGWNKDFIFIFYITTSVSLELFIAIFSQSFVSMLDLEL